MAYLITGATGLIGKNIVTLCNEQNIEVHYLTTSKNKIQTTDNYKGFFWNPYYNIIDEEAFKGVTTIIHLAGATVAKRWTKAYRKEILDSRVNSASLLYETLDEIEHSVKHFISASAIGLYENSEIEFHSEDSVNISNNFLSEVVVRWEEVADQFLELKMKVSKIRIGLVLDSKEGALPELVKPIKMFMGAAFGKGNQWQSWIHVKDLASIFLYIAENKLEGVYNAVAPNAVTQNKLIKLSAEELSKPLWLPNIPKFITKLMFGKMSILLLSSIRANSSKIENKGFLFEFPSLRKALQFLLEKDK